ncbi:MAG: secondary thiamine-phosphate synthase [Bacteroidetes bacterium GWF2_33_16]|nr:MAG: secondary thiamine-phosphate synthase [Bacteroidetes bacterium GWE2_32_14]OFY06008.1 MAG: secondary thiamine-phosphate synthase [Bacteroidetes bacterium GWF2_33_16]
MVDQKEIILPQFKRGYHIITDLIIKEIGPFPEKGILHLFIKHTSASLIINENADPTVTYDFERFLNHLIPDGDSLFRHTMEGSDDMPAHIKSSLFGQSITIPITNHSLNLGIWQGIYLCEFRNHGGNRKVVITIYS